MGCQAFHSTPENVLAKRAKCFVVTCMDFRLIDESVKFMRDRGYDHNYDEFVLAGASLGFTQTTYPHWGLSLLDHMNIGKDLHHFGQIIFIDHKDCGAYKKFYPHFNPQQEVALHKKHMELTRSKLATIFPNFSFKGFLMDLEGQCVQIDITAEKTEKRGQENINSVQYEQMNDVHLKVVHLE